MSYRRIKKKRGKALLKKAWGLSIMSCRLKRTGVSCRIIKIDPTPRHIPDNISEYQRQKKTFHKIQFKETEIRHIIYKEMMMT